MKINQNIKDIKLSIRKITELASEKPDCMRFDIGQPDFDTPENIKQAAKVALDNKKTGYAPVLGILELRKAIAEYESRKGLNLDYENVMITNGGMGSLFSIFMGMLENNEEIILPDPHWAAYTLILDSLNINHKSVNFIKNSKLDERELKNAISKNTKMLLINSPSNPTGEVLNAYDLNKIAEIAKKYNLIVISDEVYERLLYNNFKPISIAKYIPKSTIRINSCSKTYAMTGWRIGWLTAPKEVVNELKKCNRANTACVNTFAQYGALEALTGNQESVENMRRKYEKRYRVMKNRIQKLGWDFPEVNGAFYMFPKTGKDSWPYALDLIKKAGVSTVPGEAFGKSGKYHLRFCFGSASVEDINYGFDRIEKHEKSIS
jgi:aspartate/methionine/tyrosine aminotransferase